MTTLATILFFIILGGVILRGIFRSIERDFEGY